MCNLPEKKKKHVNQLFLETFPGLDLFITHTKPTKSKRNVFVSYTVSYATVFGEVVKLFSDIFTQCTTKPNNFFGRAFQFYFTV